MLVGLESEKRGEREETPFSFYTLCTVMSASLSLSLCLSLILCHPPVLSYLTHIASLCSSLTAALSVSYLPLLKPLALCLSVGLMLNWTRHNPSFGNTHTHTHKCTPRLS